MFIHYHLRFIFIVLNIIKIVEISQNWKVHAYKLRFFLCIFTVAFLLFLTSKGALKLKALFNLTEPYLK